MSDAVTTTSDPRAAAFSPRSRPDPVDVALALVALAVAALGLRLYWGYAGDDTFIHLTYARNLAEGNGFSFNPGEPSYGSTAPLWTLIVAGASRALDGNVYLAAKLLGGLSTLLSVVVFRSLALVVTRSYRVSGLATITFAVDPWLWKWGGSGMETSFAVLLALLAVRLHVRRRTGGGLPVSAAIMGVGTLVRPEMVALFLIAWVDRALIARRPVGEVMFALFVYLVPILPWVLYAFASFGDFLPTTVHAKSGHMAYGEIVSRTVKILGSSYAPAIVAAVIGLAVAATRDLKALLAPLRERTVVWGWAIGLPLAYLATQSYVASRYLLLATPFVVLIGHFAIVAALSTRRTRVIAASIVLALTVASSAIVQATVVYPRTRFTRGVDDRLIEVAEWVRANTPPSALVAVHEVGAIGFFADRRVLDTAGLVTPEALPYVIEGRVPELIREMRPRYYVSSGDDRIDRQVMDPFSERMTLLFERPVQRGGSSERFAEPLRVGVYAFEGSPTE
jgi:hypothetical protein